MRTSRQRRLETLARVLLCCLGAPVAAAGSNETEEVEDEAEEAEETEEQPPPLPSLGTVVKGARIRPDDQTSAAAPVTGERLRQSGQPTLLEAVSREVPWVYVSSRGSELHGIAAGSSGFGYDTVGKFPSGFPCASTICTPEKPKWASTFGIIL